MFPHRAGTLNFYDDPSHLKPISVSEVISLVSMTGLSVIKSGGRKCKRRLLLLPIIAIYSILTYGYVPGPALWDIYGFANYVVAQKKNSR
ncbi:MAG: hypothetical protein QXQ46_04475 [Thermoplasmatales archaeon]